MWLEVCRILVPLYLHSMWYANFAVFRLNLAHTLYYCYNMGTWHVACGCFYCLWLALCILSALIPQTLFKHQPYCLKFCNFFGLALVTPGYYIKRPKKIRTRASGIRTTMVLLLLHFMRLVLPPFAVLLLLVG